jgi:hypothetical protein
MSVELQEEVGGKILILTLSDKLAKEDYAHEGCLRGARTT